MVERISLQRASHLILILLSVLKVSSQWNRTSFKLQRGWLCRCRVRKIQGSRHYIVTTRVYHKALDATPFGIESNTLFAVVRTRRINNRKGSVRRIGLARNKLAVFGSNGNNNTIGGIDERGSVRIFGRYGTGILVRKIRI